ncbi:unnamed protein product [Polarella glacialis]|uniref:Uncharacterized protein n=1 Tax=Polarella glacialis TaxID=89957 RepID=A0A813E3W3_POLGL|nr:unnamed protein product [Polarella glacialis]
MARFGQVSLAMAGAAMMHAIAWLGPCPSSAAWGWMLTPKEAPELVAKAATALWSCSEAPVGIDGGESDQYRTSNNLEYGDAQMVKYFTDHCKCSVLPKPGFTCDIAQTLLVGKALGEHKRLKAGDVIQPHKLGPECTNTGYPGAPIDCQLQWAQEPVCKEAEMPVKGDCCSTM